MKSWTLDEIRACTVGALRVEDAAPGTRFRRFTPGAEAIYRDNPAAMVRVNCPSAVRLRFRSDTRLIRLGLAFGEAARPFYQGALGVDGNAPVPFGPGAATDRWAADIYRQSDRQSRAFELWLPHLSVNHVTALETDDDATVIPLPPSGPRWLAFGDSITQGMTAPLPHRTYVARCASALDAAVINLGVGGATLAPALATSLPEPDIDLVTLAYGVNDFSLSLPLAPLQEAARRLADALAARWPRARLVLLTPVPWVGRTTPNDLGLTLQDYRDALAGAVRDRPAIAVIDGRDLVPDDARWFCDGVHPNDEGMGIYADNLLARLGLGKSRL